LRGNIWSSEGERNQLFYFEFFYPETNTKGSTVRFSFPKRLDLNTTGTRSETAEFPAEHVEALGRWLDTFVFQTWINSIFCFLPLQGRVKTSSTPKRTSAFPMMLRALRCLPYKIR